MVEAISSGLRAMAFSDLKAQTPEPLKNRQTSSNSKLLSVSNHGTRIVFSDGGGNIKWVEGNGFFRSESSNSRTSEEPADVIKLKVTFSIQPRHSYSVL